MARGLGHLGHHGYSHNDMKPENVLMFKDSGGVLVAKIADLGCALGACSHAIFAVLYSYFFLRFCSKKGVGLQRFFGLGGSEGGDSFLSK